MKRSEEHIRKEVTQTLASLEGIKKVSPKPFLYTRVLARREKIAYALEQEYSMSPVMIRITLAALFVLFVFSMYSVITVQRKDVTANQTPPVADIESFIEDYYPLTPTVYNFDEKINQ